MNFVGAGAGPVAPRGTFDAGAVLLRLAVPADGAALHAFCVAFAPPELMLFCGGALSAAEFAAGGPEPRGFGLVATYGPDVPDAQRVPASPLGLARLCADPGGVAGEFALIVHPLARGRGLGGMLLGRLLGEAGRRGLLLVRGAALPGNAAMLALARACGFQLLTAADGAVELARVLARMPAQIPAPSAREAA